MSYLRNTRKMIKVKYRAIRGGYRTFKRLFPQQQQYYTNITDELKPTSWRTNQHAFLSTYFYGRRTSSNRKIPSMLTSVVPKREFLFARKLYFVQNLKFFFGCLSQRQLFTLFRTTIKSYNASTPSTALFKQLLSRLETRLDIVLLRTGAAKTIFNAKQLIHHGQIMVNNAPVRGGSYVLRPGDVFTVVSTRAVRKTVASLKEKFWVHRGMHEHPDDALTDQLDYPLAWTNKNIYTWRRRPHFCLPLRLLTNRISCYQLKWKQRRQKKTRFPCSYGRFVYERFNTDLRRTPLWKEARFVFNRRATVEKRKIPLYVTYNSRLQTGVFLRRPCLRELEYPFEFSKEIFETIFY